MTWKRKIAVFLLCVSALHLTADIGFLPGSEPIRQMFAEASLVCRCSVLNVKILRKEKIPGDVHGNTTNVMSALLKEEKIYKSDQKGYQNITLVYEEDPFSPDIGLRGGESNLLFFLKRKDSEYAFVDPRKIFQMPSDQALKSAGSGIEQFEADLIAGLQTSDRNSLLSSLRLLQSLDNLSSVSISMLKHLMASSDAEIALAVHAVLMKTGDPEEVAQFAAFEEKSINGAFVRSISIGSSMKLMSISSALNRVRSDKALPSLTKLADSSIDPIKIGALDAIRAIKSPSSIPTLIKHLDDSDSHARYIAVISLSEITKKNDAPFIGLFEKDESKYINIWKTWWEQEGRAIYDPSPINPSH